MSNAQGGIDDTRARQSLGEFLGHLWPFLKPHGAKILLLYVFALINVATMIGLPLLIQQAVDRGIVAKDPSLLLRFSLLILGTGLVQYVSFRSQGVIMMKVGNGVLHDLRKALFDRLQLLSISFFDRHKAGSIMTRVTSDVQVLEELLLAGLDTLLVDIILIVGLTAAMISLSPYLSLMLLFVMPMLLLIVFRLQRRISRSAEHIQGRLSAVNSFLNESLSGIRVIRAFAREQSNIRKFHQVNGEYFDESRRFYPLHAYFWQSVATLNSFSQGLVLLIGGILLSRNLISIGIIVAYLSYVTRLFQPMQKISNMLNQLTRARVSGRRIFEILSHPVSVTDPAPERLADRGAIRGEVEFLDVHFAYTPDEPVLRGISFSLEAGKLCAIAGHTGSGKSTMVNLVSRFYDCSSGQILIDGHDIRDYSQKHLRSHMAVVMQDPQIFSGSVAQNILFGKPEASLDEVKQVCRTLGIHEMIEGFPRGYDTELGQDGGQISLGQRQLIAFARALIRNPSILILDEASAYLDSETEAIVQKAIKALMKGRTSFVIAHRLSTIRNADIILVLEKGLVAERGTHEQLKASGGIYATMLGKDLA